mgnify:CR=1 FL=1
MLFRSEDMIKRVALSRFGVGFSVQHNQRVVHRFEKAASDSEKQRRVAQVCGPAFIDNAVRVDFDSNGLRLTGWVSLPTFSRSQQDLQYFYVNGRVNRTIALLADLDARQVIGAFAFADAPRASARATGSWRRTGGLPRGGCLMAPRGGE